MKKHVTKKEWVALFDEIGLNDKQKMQWHKLFETRHPEAHQGFLEWLGIAQKEIEEIRAHCR